MQFDRWREEVSAAFVPLDASSTASDGTARFDGGLQSGAVGSLHISEVSGHGVDVRRTRATIRRSDPGLVKVGVQLRGRGVVVQREREAVLAPGDFAVYDTSEPYELHFDDEFAMFVLMFPRASLKIRPNDLAHVSAVRIDGSVGVGSLVSPFLTGLRIGLSDGMTSSKMFDDAVLDLVSAALDERAPHDSRSPGAVILAGSRSFIEDNLQNPDLNTAMVAASQHISPRYLQKVFESDGVGVAAWIRSRRLERCRRDLQDPRFTRESIGSICARYGLVDSAHFSRVFREAYGMSPRSARSAPVCAQ